MEIDCTENNSVYTNPGKQSTSLVSGLFFADSMAQLLKTEIRSLVWWNFRNGGTEANNNNSPSLYGWRNYGDYGVVESGSNFPIYYVSKLMSQFAGASDHIVPATSDYSLLSMYAAKQQSGRLALLVINKSPTYSLNGAFSLTGAGPRSSVVIYSYGIPQDESARTGQGSPDLAQSRLVSVSNTFNMTFAPYSVTVLQLTKSR